MKLTRAVVACDLNKHYLDFWPIVHEAWKNIIGIPCTLVLIADEIPEEIAYKEDIVLFKPIEGVHTAFIAQCIRLLYPCLLGQEEGVILSDMDMIPVYKPFFTDIIADVPSDSFYSYHDIYHEGKQIFMCYVAASPSTWKTIFTVETIEDIYALLNLWYTWVKYEGKHGGEGWFADQQILYDYIVNQWETPEKLVAKKDSSVFERLDRSNTRWQNLDFELMMRIKHGYYKDFHLPPFEANKQGIMNIYNFLTDKSSPSEFGK